MRFARERRTFNDFAKRADPHRQCAFDWQVKIGGQGLRRGLVSETALVQLLTGLQAADRHLGRVATVFKLG